MKIQTIFFLLIIFGFSTHVNSQTGPVVSNKKYKIIFQLASGDTAVHRSTIKQLFNALAAAPNSKIEVVCHNAGISFLQRSKTNLVDKIQELKNKGVVFAACENTLRDRKIDKTDIVPQATFVPAGVIELADKQTKGWAYIKAGN
ncbi:MAG: DsrE family protein [Saprospiraceae bacterium]|nr:DsrE family protein [Saprospiraceae bacterium]